MVKGRQKRRGPVTAKELMDSLMKDPAFVARMQEKEKKLEENRARYQEAAKGVLAELAAAGFHVQYVGELVQQFGQNRIPYIAAIPILMNWLPRVTYEPLKEDIVRTLSVPWAKPMAARLMVDEYIKAGREEGALPGGLRWAIGNALEVVADDSVFSALVRLATDRLYGGDRDMVVVALGNMKDRRAVKILIQLLDDTDVAGHAVMALGKLKAPEARAHLERFLQHPKAWIRKEAKKAIAAIDRAVDTK